jgi:hypothetical protein
MKAQGMKLLKIAVLALTFAAVPAQAQILHTLRDSRMNFSYLYGYADQTFMGGFEGSVGNTASSDGMHMESSESGEGTYIPNGNHWTAALQWNLDHAYSLVGEENDIRRISAHGSSSLSTASTGNASVDLGANGPGNILILGFTFATDQWIRLDGFISTHGGSVNNHAEVIIERVNGSERQGVLLEFLPGEFHRDVFLPSGLYEITGHASAASSGNDLTGSSYDFIITPFAVPEPRTWMLMGMGLAAIATRSRLRRTR